MDINLIPHALHTQNLKFLLSVDDEKLSNIKTALLVTGQLPQNKTALVLMSRRVGFNVPPNTLQVTSGTFYRSLDPTKALRDSASDSFSTMALYKYIYLLT